MLVKNKHELNLFWKCVIGLNIAGLILNMFILGLLWFK